MSCPIKNISRQLSPSTNISFKITVHATSWKKEANYIDNFFSLFLKTMEYADNQLRECYFIATAFISECDHIAVVDSELTS